jgi:hypothetical protein
MCHFGYSIFESKRKFIQFLIFIFGQLEFVIGVCQLSFQIRYSSDLVIDLAFEGRILFFKLQINILLRL